MTSLSDEPTKIISNAIALRYVAKARKRNAEKYLVLRQYIEQNKIPRSKLRSIADEITGGLRAATLFRSKLRGIRPIQRIKDVPCADCGIKYPTWVMEFDHLDAAAKVTNIGNMVSGAYSIGTIQKEIAKCEVVCANCHRQRTYARAQAAKHQI